MDEETKKDTKILETDDIRKQCQNWTLAGDVGLLTHLENFSEKIYNKSQETQALFNELLDSYDDINNKIGNTTNQFLALQNCQFVENRVYDEETPTEETVTEQKIDENEREKVLLSQYKEAVEVGIKLLDTHFNEVELPLNSDSEEDDMPSREVSLIWKPKNPYSHKKFPLLIGSSEWWADDTVGLETVEDSLNVSKEISESESESESVHGVEKSVHLSLSSSSSSLNMKKADHLESNHFRESSEDIFGLDKNYNYSSSNSDLFGVINNISNEKLHKISPNIDSSIVSNSETISSEKTLQEKEDIENISDDNFKNTSKKINSAFARELAAKLGTFNKEEFPKEISPSTTTVENKEENKNNFKNVINKDVEENKFIKSSNTDEDSNSLFFESENDDKLFSGSSQLFNESEKDLFQSDYLNKFKSKPLKNNERINELPNSNQGTLQEKSVKGLFDDIEDNFDDDNDEDALFFSKPSKKKNDLFLDNSLPQEEGNTKENKKKIKLFDDDLDEKDSDDLDIFKIGSKRENTSDLSIQDNSNKIFAPLNKTIENNENSVSKVLDNNVHIPSKESVDVPVVEEKNDLFSDLSTDDISFEKKSSSGVKSNSAPYESDNNESLFQEKFRQPDTLSLSSSRSSLFDDVNISKSRLSSVFEKDKSNKSEDNLFNDLNNSLFADDSDLFTKVSSKFSKDKEITSSLFDDFDDTNDLFSKFKNTEESFVYNKSEKISCLLPEDGLFEANSSRDILDGEVKENVTVKIKNTFDEDLFNDKSATKKFLDSPEHVLENSSISKVIDSKSENTNKVSLGTSLTIEKENTDHVKEEKSEFLKPYASADESILFSSKSKPSEKNDLKSQLFSTVDSNTDKIPKSTSVGKLNIPKNLKNKLENVVKMTSSESSIEASLKKKNKITEEQENEKLNEPLEPTSLLKCPSRDRVKIPVRRRPQSRQARQEAIRKSGIDFLNEDENVNQISFEKSSSVTEISNISNTLETEKTSKPLFSSHPNYPLSPSTDEEDFFNVPELDKNVEKEDQELFKNNLFKPETYSEIADSILFNRTSSSSPNNKCEEKSVSDAITKEEKVDDLFFTPESKPSEKKIKIFDFDDDDDDDDDIDGNEQNLFKSNPTKFKVKGKEDLFKSNLEEISKFDNKNKKKSLFDIESDDENDDLFGQKSKILTKDKIPVATPKVTPGKITSENDDKSKDNKSFVDPLGLMSSNE